MSQINTLIKPTNECNMRCKYCFAEKYGYSNSLLDLKILKKYLKLLSQKYDYINLVWHGGEPLIAPLSYYEEAYDYCQKLDSKFIYSIQTNGTLLNNENIDFFKEHDTSIGLSFDGLSNSKTRGNTQTILNKIELLKSKEMYPGAIIVVNQNNVNSLIEEYEYFKKLNLGMKMNPMFNDGAAKENNFFNLNPDNYIHSFVEFFKYWVFDTDCNINVSTCMNFANLIINEYSGICTHSSCLKKWLCLDSNGHIYPCDRLCLNEYDLGYVPEMNVIDEAFENEKFIKLLQKNILRRQTCIETCEYFKNCYGGCNANAILSEINNNDISCYIQRGILSELKKIIIKLECEKNYDKLNYNFAKILIKKER